MVLVGLKPIVDLRRLLNGHEVAHAPFNTLNERRVCRSVTRNAASACSNAALYAVLTRYSRGRFAVQDHRGVHAVAAIVDAADHVPPGKSAPAENPSSTLWAV